MNEYTIDIGNFRIQLEEDEEGNVNMIDSWHIRDFYTAPQYILDQVQEVVCSSEERVQDVVAFFERRI